LRELIEVERSVQPPALPNYVPAPDVDSTRQPSDFAWVRPLREGHEGWFRADFWSHLEAMPAGPRIKLMRRILGWTQQRIADELAVSLRTVIRHEKGKHRRPHSEWLWRLSGLERDHENQLLTYFSHSSS